MGNKTVLNLKNPWTKSSLFNVILLAEALNAAGGVNQLLLAGKEGVAGGTNFHLDVPGGGTGFDYIPTGTVNFGHLIFGMNLLFHVQSSSAQLLTT